jgi:hypothetical protein
MAKIIVYLGDQERNALQQLAQRELRLPRAQSRPYHSTGIGTAWHAAHYFRNSFKSGSNNGGNFMTTIYTTNQYFFDEQRRFA